MPDDVHGESPPSRPPLGMSPVVPRVLLLLGVCGVAVGLWPLAYWANRDADAVRENCGEAIDVCETDLALRAATVRRFRARTGRLPEDLTDAATDGPTLSEWVTWAERRRSGEFDRVDDIHRAIEEPWTRWGRFLWGEVRDEPYPAPGDHRGPEDDRRLARHDCPALRGPGLGAGG